MDTDRLSASWLVAIVFSVTLAIRAYAVMGVTTSDSVTGLYIPGWADNRDPTSAYFFNTSAINLRGVSHFYYAFLSINERTYEVHDLLGNLNLLVDLKSRWPSSKFLLSIGGGGFDLGIWANAATIGLDTFVESIIRTVKAANADGVDIDWEAPDKSTRTAYTNLCARLRARLDAEGAAASPPRKYWLTAATGAFTSQAESAGFDLAALKTSLDLFNIMAYDLHDPCYWESTTHFHTSWSDSQNALNYYIAQGVPRLQLVLGLAFYGHQYTLTNAANYMYPAPSVELRTCNNVVTPSYRDIMRELQSGGGGGVFVDATERSAYYVRDVRWVGFDIPETMALKIQGSRQYGLAGIMIWDASLDVPEGTLLRSVADRWTNTTRPCGGGYIGTGSCSNSAQCCSEFGYCGVGDKYCGYRCRGGPCIQFPSPPPKPPAPPPACGNGVVGGGICAIAIECCSSAGWCGTQEPWCGVNCVGGPCWYKPKAPPPSPKPPPPKSPSSNPPALKPPSPKPPSINPPSPKPPSPKPPSPTPPSPNPPSPKPPSPRSPSPNPRVPNPPQHKPPTPNPPSPSKPPTPPSPPLPVNQGFCGNGRIGNGTCQNPKSCCSSAGWCDTGEDACYWYCVGGPCWEPPPPPSRIPPGAAAPPSPPPPAPGFTWCGDGVVGNKTCRLKHLCCSAAGWCAYTVDHCLNYCVGGPCWAPPPAPIRPNTTAGAPAG